MADNMHEINGKSYVEVDRKAAVGDKIIIILADTASGLYEEGDILTVTDSDRWDSGEGISVKEHGMGLFHHEYKVLEPVEGESSPSVTDILANLANRVHSLEQQLRDTQGNVEKLAEELATVKHLADSNEQDIAMLDERTFPVEKELMDLQVRYDCVQTQASRVDLTVSFILNDISATAKKKGGESIE
jgi:hypothetical protein